MIVTNGSFDAVLCQEKKDAVATGDVEGASVEELNQKISTLEKEKNKEEEYRNYMQLERVSRGSSRGPHAAPSAWETLTRSPAAMVIAG